MVWVMVAAVVAVAAVLGSGAVLRRLSVVRLGEPDVAARELVAFAQGEPWANRLVRLDRALALVRGVRASLR